MITAEVLFSSFYWGFIIMAILVLVAVILDAQPPYKERQARRCDRRAARADRRVCSTCAGPEEAEFYFQVARYWRECAREWRSK